MKMLRKFLSYYRPYWKIVLFVVTGSIVTSGLDLIFPSVVRYILNTELPAHHVRAILRWSALLFALYVVNSGLLFAINYYGHIMSIRVERDMRQELFSHLEAMPVSFLTTTKWGSCYHGLPQIWRKSANSPLRGRTMSLSALSRWQAPSSFCSA